MNPSGNDIASGPVWMEYIAFLKSKPVPYCSFYFSNIGNKKKVSTVKTTV